MTNYKGVPTEARTHNSNVVNLADYRYGRDNDYKHFPTEVLPSNIQTFVRQAAESIVFPPELVAVPLLTMLGSAIGTSRVIELKRGWSEGPTLYAASVARFGEKKSPAASEATRPTRKVQAQLRDHYKQERKLYGNAGDTGDGDSGAEPTMSRTLVEDTTVEALATVLNENPRGVLVNRDELSAWIRSMDQYKQVKGSDHQFWLSAWSGSYVAVDRKGQQEPIMLDRPSVSVYGSIQPAILPELSSGREDGLLDRFIFAYPDPIPSRWSDSEISDESRDAVHDLYMKLRRLHMEVDDYGNPVPASVHLDADAKQVYIQLVNEHREEMEAVGFPERLRGPWSKLEAYLARLTLILSLVRSVSEHGQERVEMQDVLSAQTLLDYFKGQARKVYGVLYEADPIDQLAVDVVRFVQAMGGHVKDEPNFIHKCIRSGHKPERPDELTKVLKKVAERTPALQVEQGHIGRDKDKRRALELTLKNGVPSVPSVPDTRPLTPEDAQYGWNAIMPFVGLVERVKRGDVSQEKARELATRLVLYELDRPTHDWELHAPAVTHILENFTVNEVVPF